MLLVVRREGSRLRRYVHLGTGNYHASTARVYTDFGLLTADPHIGQDVHEVFMQLTGIGRASRLTRLFQSPFTLHDAMLEYIDEETHRAMEGEPARIIAKMNALIEPKVIRALYRASQAGVEIDLIVRGRVCAAARHPGGIGRTYACARSSADSWSTPGCSTSRTAATPRLFCASADWMNRNLFQRVETCFPILDAAMRERVIEEGLLTYLDDNMQAWHLDSGGRYRRTGHGAETAVSAQPPATRPAVRRAGPGRGLNVRRQTVTRRSRRPKTRPPVPAQAAPEAGPGPMRIRPAALPAAGEAYVLKRIAARSPPRRGRPAPAPRSARVSGCASSHPGGNATVNASSRASAATPGRKSSARGRFSTTARRSSTQSLRRTARLPRNELLEDRGRELPPVPSHQRGQHRLRLTREPRHVAVGEQVRAVLVVLVMGDEDPRLVQARGPAEKLLRILAVEPPLRGHLAMQREGGDGDPLPLCGVDPIALDPALHGGVAHVLVADAADEVEQQTLTERHLGDVEVLDVERVQGGRQHRDPTREHGAPVVP